MADSKIARPTRSRLGHATSLAADGLALIAVALGFPLVMLAIGLPVALFIQLIAYLVRALIAAV